MVGEIKVPQKPVPNMIVWEAGYNLCLDAFRIADSIKTQKVADELRSVALGLLYEVSKGKVKMSKAYIRRLRIIQGHGAKLSTLLMFLHDLGYISTDKYLSFNQKLKAFTDKILKLLKYAERKVVKK